MKPLMNLHEHTRLNEALKESYTQIDDLFEGMLDWIGSPIKMTKIKNNMKKYQKALTQKAINDLDFEKKKQAAGGVDKEQADVLRAANKTKNTALSDQASAISDRMDHLASSDGLKIVVKVGKNKSKLAQAKMVMKAASGEEAKALKLKISTLEDRVHKDENQLKDYAKKAEKGKEEGGKEEGGEQEQPKVKDDTKKDDTKKDDTKKDDTKTDDGKGKAEAAQKKVDDIKKKIDDVTNLLDKQKESDPDKDTTKYDDLLGKRQGELEDAQDELKKAKETKDESSLESFYYTLDEKLNEIEKGVDSIKKEVIFPSYKIQESISQKFTRLMDER